MEFPVAAGMTTAAAIADIRTTGASIKGSTRSHTNVIRHFFNIYSTYQLFSNCPKCFSMIFKLNFQ